MEPPVTSRRGGARAARELTEAEHHEIAKRYVGGESIKRLMRRFHCGQIKIRAAIRGQGVVVDQNKGFSKRRNPTPAEIEIQKGIIRERNMAQLQESNPPPQSEKMVPVYSLLPHDPRFNPPSI